ncbi:bifunctional 5,10-methylenetetrahydrofolate dehydrogenase/5,10-methenyltetrahydrofolate cyclohydrolase [Helicobacter sp. MIT 14-3879]|uniref:bifunctional 5,10-methylenetetrahydrofolate dehydrogenase/5,10-methenyltetrahydrofolate cyclohydrolase n=1 Tax=Helicobacter sp. MIT 14-3879 TaxID=2040649 RepID=UPI000E1F5B6B|nr:tetrahydrofolate dehydrogenase/cyclohydrolase catalytic domain-containing protein [Helicobacter sp. MIT 14-3879]RDU64163.1 bifunctional methylenetetrahydrofolate dehydrogenase/methenyltetrahydrofolate cyclohydrolase [Helicobacter sp. MIT 14-3879]
MINKATILDGKNLSNIIQKSLALEVAKLKENNILPSLCVVLVGENPASVSYVNMKAKACLNVGIKSSIIRLSENITQDELLKQIEFLNNDKNINGILVQLPLPKHIDTNLILECININKDVDGFHPYNIGRMYANIDTFLPATPLGIMLLLKHYNISLKGRDVCIIGASNIVGKPLSLMMLNEGASVSICHILTKDLRQYTLKADIVCVGVGKINLLTADMIKENAVVIDIGINKRNNKILGDANFNEISKKASFITPVPGGVGPMTISALLQNTIKSAKIQSNIKA